MPGRKCPAAPSGAGHAQWQRDKGKGTAARGKTRGGQLIKNAENEQDIAKGAYLPGGKQWQWGTGNCGVLVHRQRCCRPERNQAVRKKYW